MGGMHGNRLDRAGFSIVELLIAMGMLAVVMAAVFTLYNMQHRTTHVEEEVVDVQQTVRMAMDYAMKDVRMAGFLLTGSTPVSSFADNGGVNSTDTITLSTASSSGAVAMINADLFTNVISGTLITLNVASAGGFNAGDVVRVVNPGDHGQPVNASFTVAAVDSAAPGLTINPNGSGSAVLFKRGYMIARTSLSAPDLFPNTIQYCVGPAPGCAPAVTACPAGQNCLMRIVNGVPGDDSVLAANVADFQVRYLLDGSSSEADSPASLSLVRAVRVTLSVRTEETAGLSGGAKTRVLTGIAKIRNR